LLKQALAQNLARGFVLTDAGYGSDTGHAKVERAFAGAAA
jgi:SRSO17 transposase